MSEMKQCNKCGAEKPATTEYFHRVSSQNDNLRPNCKLCKNEYDRQWRKASPEKAREIDRRKRKLLSPETKRERGRLWRKANPDYYQHYRRANSDKINKRQRQRQYKRVNPRKYRNYKKDSPERNRKRYLARRSRKASVAHKFTRQDENRALDYFNGRCAVCERPLTDLFGEHIAAMDHWIPLSSTDCPGTIPTNMIPLCHGIDGCNNKKHARDPKEWLILEFGKRKAREILKRIEVYFEWVKQPRVKDAA